MNENKKKIDLTKGNKHRRPLNGFFANALEEMDGYSITTEDRIEISPTDQTLTITINNNTNTLPIKGAQAVISKTKNGTPICLTIEYNNKPQCVISPLTTPDNWEQAAYQINKAISDCTAEIS